MIIYDPIFGSQHVLALMQRSYGHPVTGVGQNVQQLLHLGESVLPTLLVTNLSNHITERLDIFLQRLDLVQVLPVLLAH